MMFMKIYNALITVLYPLVIKRYINKRKENGKEDVKRFNERIGRPALKRPEGKLIWLHGASVGESVSMLPLIQKNLGHLPSGARYGHHRNRHFRRRNEQTASRARLSPVYTH